MKKKILYFIIPLFLFFLGISTVFADNCSTVKNKIDNYQSYKDVLSSIDCTDDADINNVATCNELNVKKNIVVTELMKLNEENNICSTYRSQVDTIIKENEDKCGKIFNSDFNKFVNNVMALFYIAGPILLILFGSLDYAKATVSSERDAFKKANKNFAKRLAATILLFVAPAITNFIISFNVSDKYLSGNAYTCNYDYIVFNKKYNIVYTPRNNSSTTNINGNGDILVTAEQVHQKHKKEKWVWSITKNLIYNDIEAQSNNPNRTTCCAGYVAEVLYKAGIFDAATINQYSYHAANSGIGQMLKNHGWIEITDYDSLQPGDISLYTEHVQIYAGKDSNGTMVFYSEGQTAAIQDKDQPYVAVGRSKFVHAYRKP